MEPTGEPIGLSAARAALGRIAQVKPATARILREDALRSLEWAEAEIRDGEFASDLRVLREQIAALRVQFEGCSDNSEVSSAEPPARRKPGASSGELRTIRKYPNKRLYDTVESRYITLADIRRLVVDRIEFVVIDRKAQEDITRSVLFQVIAEQEHGVEPLMSRDFLAQIIRSYGGALQGVIGSYLEQSLKLFTSQQRDARDRAKGVGVDESGHPLNNLAQKNYQRWREVQDEIYRTLLNAVRARADSREDDKVSGMERVPAGAHKE